MRHVFVAEDENLRLRKAGTVDDRCVVESIGDDEVFLAQHSRDSAGVCRESGLKDGTGFDISEASDLLLERHVNLHRSSDSANGAGSDAELSRRLKRRLAQPGMGG